MKNRNLLESFNNAVNGIVHTFLHERNMKYHMTAGALVIILSIFYGLSRLEFLIVGLTIVLVLVCEMFNTSIEILVDIIIDIYHPKAKIIKDVAAGAVMISAIFSLAVAYFLFFDRVSKGLEWGIASVKHSPVHITVIALAVTVTLVLVLKLLIRKGTPFQGGMPSGHAAVAFSITTAVSLWTDEAAITLFCLFISLLVIQSRIEGKIHNIVESAAGAALGFLITLLLYQLIGG